MKLNELTIEKISVLDPGKIYVLNIYVSDKVPAPTAIEQVKRVSEIFEKLGIKVVALLSREGVSRYELLEQIASNIDSDKAKDECIYCGWEMEGSVCNNHCGTDFGRCLEKCGKGECKNKVIRDGRKYETKVRPKRCLDCTELDLASLNSLMCCKTGDEIKHKYEKTVADNCPLPKE